MLWVLSGELPIRIGTIEFSLPGYMVWAAVLYALFGSILTYALGGGLIEAGNVRQGREADVRSVLIRARENAEGIALMRGEADERRAPAGRDGRSAHAWHAQTRGQGSLALLTSSLAYLAPVVPLVVALPRYLGGELQLGGLMQTAQAFSNVQWALSWLIDNFPALRRLARLDRSRRAASRGAARSRGHDRDAGRRAYPGDAGRTPTAWCCARSACRGPTARRWWPRPRSRSNPVSAC